MRVWVGGKEIDILSVGSVVLEFDDLDKKLIKSMSPRETKYGASVVLPERTKVFRTVMGPPRKGEETVSFEVMSKLLRPAGA